MKNVETDILPGYILTDSNLQTEEHRVGTEGLGEYGGNLLYDCNVYAKGINICDPKCEEENILVYSYRRADLYSYFIYCSSSYYYCSSYEKKIVTLGDPITTDEKNAVNKLDEEKAQEEKMRNELSAWKNSCPAFAEQ